MTIGQGYNRHLKIQTFCLIHRVSLQPKPLFLSILKRSTKLLKIKEKTRKISTKQTSMNYEQRLKAAATIILDADASAVDAPLNTAEIGVTATLKPYQVEGVSWLIRRYLIGVNVILGDEMGLGKTLQALCFLSYLKVNHKSPGSFLVLCPLSVTDGWISEIAKFTPKLKVLRYVGDKEQRRNLRKTSHEDVKEHPSSTNDGSILPFDVLLTTYDIALMDQDFLSQIPWHYAIIDEAQRLKNPSSVLYNVLRERFLMPRVLLMTGTPIQNNLTELWALMHFCMPSVFGKREQFLSTFKEAGDPRSEDVSKVKGQLQTLKCISKAFMLQRTKSKLIECGNLVLPPLTEITVMTPLVSLQKKVYTSISRKELPKLLSFSSGTSNHQSLQNIVIQLRKACSHPYLFPGIEPEPYEEGEHIVQASGKLIILDQLLKKLHDSGHRVLLFAQMTHTLDILQDFLELRKYSYERLDGSVRAEERFSAIRSFSRQSETPNSEFDNNGAFVFMISTRAGGVGLNLVAADTVIFYEQDWNPQVDKQALQRAHRIGQMNHVLSVNLVTRRTVEEIIMQRAERKLQLSHNIIGNDIAEQGGEKAGVGSYDLRSIIFGLQKFDPLEISTENSDELNMLELNTMIEKAIAMRDDLTLGKVDKYEFNRTDQNNGFDVFVGKSSSFADYDPGLDEASYQSWVEKFKEASQSSGNEVLDLERNRALSEDKHLKLKAAREKAKEEKLSKWESLGYHSLSIEDPDRAEDVDILSDSGSLLFVVGDCTDPRKVCPSEPAIILSCVDSSGKWGRGGMFDALAQLSSSVPDAYHRAFEFKDLHLGDLHLIRINEDTDGENIGGDSSLWVALAVVQSYNPRRKVPRGDVSIPDLERCLSKVSFVATQNSASIHMPRIGYQHDSDRSHWYTVERLLRKYASIHGIKIYVYYYRREGFLSCP